MLEKYLFNSGLEHF